MRSVELEARLESESKDTKVQETKRKFEVEQDEWVEIKRRLSKEIEVLMEVYLKSQFYSVFYTNFLEQPQVTTGK